MFLLALSMVQVFRSETQQSSDTTYRIYDYDGSQMVTRDLHLEQSKDVIELGNHEPNTTPITTHIDTHCNSICR